jgi:hypothetical protein
LLRLFAIFALAVCAHVASAGDALLPDFAPPGTKIVIGIELRSILDSPMLHQYLADAKVPSSIMMAQSPFAGLDPLRDLDEIVIASTGAKSDAPSLVILRGRFDASRIHGGIAYHGVPVFQGKGQDQAAAILDPGTAIAGPLAQVRAGIDRRGARNPLSAELAARLTALRGRYAVWAAGEGFEGVQMGPGAPDGLQSADRFEFGIALEQGLQLTGSIHARSAADAEKMSQALAMVEMMAKTQPSAQGVAFESHVAENTLTVSVHIPEDVLKKSIEQQKAAFARGFMQSTAKTAPVRPAAPVSRETKTLRDDSGNDVLVTLPGRR